MEKQCKFPQVFVILIKFKCFFTISDSDFSMFCIGKPAKPRENICFFVFSTFSLFCRSENTKNPKINNFQLDSQTEFWIFGFFGFVDFLDSLDFLGDFGILASIN